MLRRLGITLFITICFFIFLPKNPSSSWGFYGHKKINEMAIYTLPPEMVAFYKQHMAFIIDHSIDPDKRRYIIKEEAPRHYIDIDHYGKHPFDSVPKFWTKAVEKYTEDSLMAYGIVPWQIEKICYQLTNAFIKEDIDQILHYSADLGHYVADAHVPLHTTENYNGQLTNQKGIHGFWENRIPELKAEHYNYFVGRAIYIEKPIISAWKAVYDSHMAVDSVLKFEAQLNASFPKDKKYSYETRGKVMTKVYSVEYTYDYDNMIKGQVERRMRESIIMVGSLWYTAWVNAGKPNLEHLKENHMSDSLQNTLQKQEALYIQQKSEQVQEHED